MTLNALPLAKPQSGACTDPAESSKPWSRVEFERRLRAKGDYYHIHHPYHLAMHEGRCTPAQIRGWVANRFYYQLNIPVNSGGGLLRLLDLRALRPLRTLCEFACYLHANGAKARCDVTLYRFYCS